MAESVVKVIKVATDRTNYGQHPRIRIKKGWMGAGREGFLYFTMGKNEHLGQSWSMVLMDDDDDPDCHKTAGLEYLNGIEV